MSYSITTLGPESGYSFVNVRQIYDLIASKISANGWTLVDTVDWVSAPNTFRRYVWKAASAATGLPSDFYVIFEAQFTTSGTVWLTGPGALKIYVAGAYNTSTHVASKMITVASATAITLNSDLTAPTSWDLTTALPSTAGAIPLFTGLYMNGTASLPIMIAARADHFIASNGLASSSNYGHVYVGAVESVMTSTDDPMPVMLAWGMGATAATSSTNASGSTATGQRVGFLTHPKLTAGGSYAYVFQGDYLPYHSTSPSNSGPMYYNEIVWTGNTQLGAGTPPLWAGTGVVKCPVASAGNTQTANSRGGRRGYLKGFRTTGSLLGSNQGDLYSIDGATYSSLYTAGSGNQGALVDTTL